MLQGPYTILSAYSWSSLRVSGVYILSKNGKRADYVGRSDTDVRTRLIKSAAEGNGYTHFWFEYTSSPREAFLMECRYYHQYIPSDNSVHPAVPGGTFWRCPIGGCPWA